VTSESRRTTSKTPCAACTRRATPRNSPPSRPLLSDHLADQMKTAAIWSPARWMVVVLSCRAARPRHCSGLLIRRCCAACGPRGRRLAGGRLAGRDACGSRPGPQAGGSPSGCCAVEGGGGSSGNEYVLSARTASRVVLGRPVRLGARNQAMTCSKAGASPACSGVMTNAGGLLWPSATRSIVVASTPVGATGGMVCRLTGRGPFLRGPGGVPVCAHDGGVDRDDPVEVAFGGGLGEQGGERPSPTCRRRPTSAAGCGRPSMSRRARAGPSMVCRCGT
jgi:hypothetical protein